jgi:aspartate/methionine/tyrosine aminotransferase
MFSHRLGWPCPTNRLSRLLREKRNDGAPILDLTESNPTRVGLDYPVEEIAAAFASSSSGRYEPTARGLPTAREAVGAYYARSGHAVPPDRIVLTAGTSEAYSFLFKLLADPGDTVLVPRPSYPLFEYLAGLESVRVAAYPLEYEGRWRIDLDSLERAAAARDRSLRGDTTPRAVVVVNPNNPTGSALSLRERGILEDFCSPRGAAILSDEVFFDYVREPGRVVSLVSRPAPSSEDGPLTFTLGGLSKACGLPQMKLGWIVVDGPPRMAGEALERIELIADTYLSVGTAVQIAAPRLIELGDRIRATIRSRLEENAALLAASVVAGSPCRVLEADGGWYAVLQVPALRPEEELVLALLAETDVLVHPGYFFDFPREAYLVLSLLPRPATFRDGLQRLLDMAARA